MTGEISGYIITLMVASIVSVLASSCVIVTCLMFKTLRSKLFMQMIAFISLSDAIGNIAYILPTRPSNNNWWCVLQSIFNLTCYPMSWLWTLVLVYFLYCLVATGKIPSNLVAIHSLCWGLPIVLFLLTLAFAKIGVTGDYYHFEVCSEYGGLAEVVYHSIAYYGLLLGCFVLMFILFWKILAVEKLGDARVFQPAYIVAKSSLKLYPAALFICWAPHAVTVFLTHQFESNNETFTIIFIIADVLKILHGFATACIFFHKSVEARRSWYRLCFRRQSMMNQNNRGSIEQRTFSDDSIADSYRSESLDAVIRQHFGSADDFDKDDSHATTTTENTLHSNTA